MASQKVDCHEYLAYTAGLNCLIVSTLLTTWKVLNTVGNPENGSVPQECSWVCDSLGTLQQAQKVPQLYALVYPIFTPLTYPVKY